MHRSVRRAMLLAALTTTAVITTATTASAQDGEVPEPGSFTSMFSATATPDMVVNAEGAPTPGQPGATGVFNYRINSAEEIICYDITLEGVTPPYQSPARTATHVHEGGAGNAGPPRLAFPNPEDDGTGTLRSEGCMQGPFTTGIMANGADTGTGFSLARIEADPSAFFTDTHTAQFVAGAVRGQLTRMPMGGAATGAGGASGMVDGPLDDRWTGVAAIGAAGLLAGSAVALLRRRRARR